MQGTIERPASRAAVCQALRHFFNLPTKQVAALVNVSSQYVSAVTNDSTTVVSWQERQRQQESIDVAWRLLQDSDHGNRIFFLSENEQV
jgi:hypothetical protein